MALCLRHNLDYCVSPYLKVHYTKKEIQIQRHRHTHKRYQLWFVCLCWAISFRLCQIFHLNSSRAVTETRARAGPGVVIPLSSWYFLASRRRGLGTLSFPKRFSDTFRPARARKEKQNKTFENPSHNSWCGKFIETTSSTPGGARGKSDATRCGVGGEGVLARWPKHVLAAGRRQEPRAATALRSLRGRKGVTQVCQGVN